MKSNTIAFPSDEVFLFRRLDNGKYLCLSDHDFREEHGCVTSDDCDEFDSKDDYVIVYNYQTDNQEVLPISEENLIYLCESKKSEKNKITREGIMAIPPSVRGPVYAALLQERVNMVVTYENGLWGRKDMDWYAYLRSQKKEGTILKMEGRTAVVDTGKEAHDNDYLRSYGMDAGFAQIMMA